MVTKNLTFENFVNKKVNLKLKNYLNRNQPNVMILNGFCWKDIVWKIKWLPELCKSAFMIICFVFCHFCVFCCNPPPLRCRCWLRGRWHLAHRMAVIAETSFKNRLLAKRNIPTPNSQQQTKNRPQNQCKNDSKIDEKSIPKAS